jgi:hypothetical protein
VQLAHCARTPGRELADFDFWLKASEGPNEESSAPLQEFYMYRATARGMLDKHNLGDVNTGNLEGVIWYLANEIVTNYGQGPRCPRRFNISEIHRLRVRVKATEELVKEGMHYGVRFAYDQGKCEGRCFPDNLCTGEADCVAHYDKYGYVVGCNKFADKYPFPDQDTAAPQGVWYALPSGGRCHGKPTGNKDCTWSFEHAGMITLEDLEGLSPGNSNCCKGSCTDFWHGFHDIGATSNRVQQVLKVFETRYPSMPRELAAPLCDFQQWKWYGDDPWYRHDPWL